MTDMQCMCGAVGCRETYLLDDGEPDTFVCVRCKRATPLCHGGSEAGIAGHLCDECFVERGHAAD
jgi:hypothetical protein